MEEDGKEGLLLEATTYTDRFQSQTQCTMPTYTDYSGIARLVKMQTALHATEYYEAAL